MSDPWAQQKLEAKEKKEKKKRSFLDRLKKGSRRKKKIRKKHETKWVVKPRRFGKRLNIHNAERIVAFFLFVFYAFMSLTLFTMTPYIIVPFILTMWILVAFMKLSTEKEGQGGESFA